MRMSVAFLLGALSTSGLAGCGSADKADATAQAIDRPAPPAAGTPPPPAGSSEYCELAIFYRQEFEKLRGRFGETHPDVVFARELAELAEAKCSGSAVTKRPKSGQWVEKDGVLTCDGFMARRADQDYCAPEVPGDWVPFEYDGQIYYLQPLQGGAVFESGSPPPPPPASR